MDVIYGEPRDYVAGSAAGNFATRGRFLLAPARVQITEITGRTISLSVYRSIDRRVAVRSPKIFSRLSRHLHPPPPSAPLRGAGKRPK